MLLLDEQDKSEDNDLSNAVLRLKKLRETLFDLQNGADRNAISTVKFVVGLLEMDCVDEIVIIHIVDTLLNRSDNKLAVNCALEMLDTNEVKEIYYKPEDVDEFGLIMERLQQILQNEDLSYICKQGEIEIENIDNASIERPETGQLRVQHRLQFFHDKEDHRSRKPKQSTIFESFENFEVVEQEPPR